MFNNFCCCFVLNFGVQWYFDFCFIGFVRGSIHFVRRLFVSEERFIIRVVAFFLYAFQTCTYLIYFICVIDVGNCLFHFSSSDAK